MQIQSLLGLVPHVLSVVEVDECPVLGNEKADEGNASLDIA
jgi:hypothetical protein